MRRLFIIRWAAPTLTAVYLALASTFTDALIINEVIIYNLIPLASLIAIFTAPVLDDLVITFALALAIIFWWLGSLLSSYNQYIRPISGTEEYIDFFYLIFYPLLLWTLHRMNRDKRRLAGAEISELLFLGAIIFSALVIFVIDKYEEGPSLLRYPQYIFILYLFFDTILIIWVARISIIDGMNSHNINLASGLLLFVSSDLAFIWLSTIDSYAIGDLLDFGWLAGITLLVQAMWCKENSLANRRTIYPFTLIVSLLISVALLTLIALGNGEVPSVLTIPAFLALLLALLRISVIVQKSHQLSDESQLAHIDELTGLANRRKIIAELSAFGEDEGAFLLLDLNGFKPINDQYGHSMGDLLLIEIAERFTRALPSSAVIARLGGDEFGVIVKGDYEETLEGAYALRASLSYPFTISGKKISVGVSIGYVHNDGRGDLLKRADMAMYQAKNSEEGVVQS